MWFRPDPEGENIGNECNKVIDQFALNEAIKADNRLHICGDDCPGCGHLKDEADDRMNWADRVGRWCQSVILRKQVQLDADEYPIKKHNRRKRGGKNG